MKIIKASEAIVVAHPVFCLFGQPGIGKSSLGYSTADPLTLDFDRGAHRASNRRDTLVIDTWADVTELMESKDALAPYRTIVIDTVGRCLDVMAVDIIEQNPKYGRDGGLSLQGFGVLKGRFQTWMARLRQLGKDVVLIAHHKEDKDGDMVIVRPDITGGSYGEVMKVADFVGFVYMRNRDRVVDFNPTDRWVGKNPAGWKPLVVPPAAKATTFLADLISQGRASLGAISDESAKATTLVEEWRDALKDFSDPQMFTDAIVDVNKLPEIVKAQVKRLIADRVKALGFTYDTKAAQFVGPVKVEAPDESAVGF